ncbi:MAG: amidase family protein [Patescibacteria group bacterium]
MELNKLTIKEASERLARSEITSVELTEAVFERIEAVESKIGAYITLTKELALKQAKESDKRRKADKPLSEIDGIPISLKDVVLTKGIKTTAASKILDDFIPPYNATVYERLMSAGSVLTGKVNTDEFTMGSSTEASAYKTAKIPHPHPNPLPERERELRGTPSPIPMGEGRGEGISTTRNPWDLSRVPGGSSGGPAAAVATDECLASVGTDTGGSIRQPASFCSITGLKVSYGLVSRYGVVSYASSFDTVGPMAKSVEDIAIVLNKIAGNDPRDSTSVAHDLPDYLTSLNSKITGKKIGIPKEFYGESLDPEVASKLRDAEKVFEKLGAKMVPVSLPLTHYAIAAYYILVKSEASSNMSRYDGIRYGHSVLKNKKLDRRLSILDVYLESRSEGFGPEVKRSIMMGTHTLSSGYFDAYYRNAAKVRTCIKREYERVFREVDVLLAPISPFPAFRLGEKIDDPLLMYLADVDTVPVNIAGIPALSIPVGFTSNNLPVGLQLIGPMWGESTLLQVGHAFQQETDWHLKKPVIK